MLFYYAFKVRPTHPACSPDLPRAERTLCPTALQVVMNQMDPAKGKRKESKAKSKETLGKLGIDLASLDLSEHEEIIAGEVVAAEDIHVSFEGASPLPRLCVCATGAFADPSAHARRHRRPRPHHLAAPRGRHLPTRLPSALRQRGGPVRRAQGCLDVRTAGMRQDDARKGESSLFCGETSCQFFRA